MHPTLNDPAFGGPTPLTPGTRRVLERLRDRGPLAVAGTGSEPLLQARLTRLARLGYVRARPGAGSFGEATRWIEITPNGVLALTPLE